MRQQRAVSRTRPVVSQSFRWRTGPSACRKSLAAKIGSAEPKPIVDISALSIETRNERQKRISLFEIHVSHGETRGGEGIRFRAFSETSLLSRERVPNNWAESGAPRQTIPEHAANSGAFDHESVVPPLPRTFGQ
jgi:hypothetical protein